MPRTYRLDVSTPKNPSLYVIIDLEDLPKVSSGRKWHAKKESGIFYASRNTPEKTERMHRIIMNAKPGEIVDHINGNGLDNRKKNLRIVSKSQNSSNSKLNCNSSSGYKGVHKRSDCGKWQARIQVNKKTIHLGYREDPKEAAKLYDEAAIKYFGEYAKTNASLGLINPRRLP